MTVVDSKTFWVKAFDADEAKGLTVRVGPWRCGPVNDWWAIIRDGAKGPGNAFHTRQDAVDWMVDDCLARHNRE